MVRQMICCVVVAAVWLLSLEPVLAAKKGIPGRREGGGTRWESSPVLLRQATRFLQPASS